MAKYNKLTPLPFKGLNSATGFERGTIKVKPEVLLVSVLLTAESKLYFPPPPLSLSCAASLVLRNVNTFFRHYNFFLY